MPSAASLGLATALAPRHKPPTRTVRPSPTPDPAADPSRYLALLDGLDLHELRSRWRQCLRTTPPQNLTRPLLLRLLAYRMQARIWGDLDPATAKFLDRIARDNARRRDAADRPKPKAVPPVPPVPKNRSLKPGTLLVREHAGVLHRVMVMADGFAWNGVTYASLSEVARAITGTRWNGPRFFGLRDKAPIDAPSETTLLGTEGLA
jgi:hypothetical protein